MSVCIASFVNKGKGLIMAADSRVCTLINNIPFQVDDDATKLYFREDDGFFFYCSGVIDMSQEVANILLQMRDFGHDEVVQILNSTYRKYAEKYPDISNIKYALQLVIPFEDQGLWRIAYYDSENKFERKVFASDDEIFVFGIGSGAKIIHPIIDRELRKPGKFDVLNMFAEAFSEAANETCGGNLTIVFVDEANIFKRTAKINDKRPIRRMPKQQKIRLAQGDGVIVSPSGQPISGVAVERKLEGIFEIIYRNSNYAKERRLILQDDGVELSTETGDIVIGHDNGSYIKLKSNGDIEINAIGKIYLNGVEYNFE